MTSYCTINDRATACERCALVLRAQIMEVTADKVVKAAGLGLLAAIGTSFLWAMIIEAFIASSGQGPSWGFVIASIVMGTTIGKAVRKGSGGRGGLGFQILACILTVMAVAFSCAPFAYNELSKESTWSPAVLVAVSIGLAPIQFAFVAYHNPLYVCFWLVGVWDAWRRNALARIDVKGPYPIEGMARPASAPGVAAPAPPPAAAAAPIVRPVLPPPSAEAKGGGMDFERPQV